MNRGRQRTAPQSLFEEPDERCVRVKICGLTRVDEAVACVQAGADLIGLNFHPGSPRFVELSRASEIIAAMARPAQVVGLFVNRPADEVARVAAELGLAWVQLHGDEPPEDLRILDRFWIIRAFRLGHVAHVGAMIHYLDQCKAAGRSPDAVLVDAHTPGQQGGTATLVAEEVVAEIPPLPLLILAGGLTPQNVAHRVAQARPWMVDVASGVESSPGRKDAVKVAAFIQAARSTPRG
jgi:phosphoribosylanthranilate isomerase